MLPILSKSLEKSRFLFIVSIVLLTGLAVSAVFYDTTQNLIYLWLNSETYSHCFFILPITFWLIWRQRDLYKYTDVQISYAALAPLFLSLLLWFIGRLLTASVIEQYGFLCIWLSSICLFLGWPLFKSLLFPFAYLLLMVPIGEGVVPALMEFTAYFTTETIRLVGIPVYREGLFISLPSGNWNVVEACSGIRYVLASVTLGTLFAYISYQSYWKRGLFILASLIVPILANGIRAFLIVMIGHFSNLKLAVGVDHLIYGWVFFGIVIFTLFSVGSIWQDKELVPLKKDNKGKIYRFSSSYLTALIIFFISLFSIKYIGDMTEKSQRQVIASELPKTINEWQQITIPKGFWQPQSPQAALFEKNMYKNNQEQIAGRYKAQFLGTKESKVVSALNRLTDDTFVWRLIHHDQRIENGHPVNEYLLSNKKLTLLAWSWYNIGDKPVINPYKAKLIELKQRIFQDNSSISLVHYFIITPHTIDLDKKRQALREFISMVKKAH